MKKFEIAPKAQYEAKYASIEKLAAQLGQPVVWAKVKQLFMPALEAYESELRKQIPADQTKRLDQVRQQFQAGETSAAKIAKAISCHPSYTWRLLKQVKSEKKVRKSRKAVA